MFYFPKHSKNLSDDTQQCVRSESTAGELHMWVAGATRDYGEHSVNGPRKASKFSESLKKP